MPVGCVWSVVPLWNETTTAGTANFGNRLSCVPGYDSSCELVPSATSRLFSKYIDESLDRTDVEGISGFICYLFVLYLYLSILIFIYTVSGKKGPTVLWT